MARVDQLREMLVRDPNDVFLNYALAKEYVTLGQHDDALRQFTRVAEIDPKYVPAYFQKANLLVSLNRHPEAKQVFTEALAVAQQIGDKHAASEISDALAMLG